MEVLFSSSDVQPRQRFAHWHDVACRRILGHEGRPRDPLHFGARIEFAGLDECELIRLDNAPMDVCRSARVIERFPSDFALVCRQISGTLHFEQGSRVATSAAGDFLFVDGQRPYAASFPLSSQMLVVKVPRPLLEAYMGLSRTSPA